jgi:predicted nucleotide-binding protein (sugar kinase/HSP70/actin superfamily)
MANTVNIDSLRKKTLPIVGKSQMDDIDAELKRFEAEERARLGLEPDRHWLEDMANLSFTKKEKGKITLLIGGLTMAHDFLVEGAFKSLGYNVVALDCPNYDALRVGKEFGNRGQCNPTYFTVGNLVKFLIYLRDEKGMSSQKIVDEYVFLTAGACGPCRFGMYVTEYRKALRDAGFDGFRVMLFQQQEGLSQATGDDSGLELKPVFFLSLVKALLAGDVINGMGYRIRPYEVVPGATDKAIEQAKKICYDALYEKRSILAALYRSKKLFEAVEVDRTIGRPKVAIIGEFWAMTTEGDGNYQLQRFIEAEGGEADIQFVSAWILYNIWEVRHDTRDRAMLRGMDSAKYGLSGVGEFGVFSRQVGLWLADKALRVAFQTYAHAVGFYDYHLPDMDEVASVAAPYYNNDLRGGEGHMEVGKLILNVAKSKANMTLSVKPFGCMPSSSVSDGVQSLIAERYPGTIFCAVETSGDGAVNFQSRVQMYMFKAKQAAAAEIEKALSETGLELKDIQSYLSRDERLKSALHHPPHRVGSTTADLVYEVAEYMNHSRVDRMLERGRTFAANARTTLCSMIQSAPSTARRTAEITRTGAIELAEVLREKGPILAEQAARAAREKVSRVLPFARPRGDEAAADLAAAAE